MPIDYVSVDTTPLLDATSKEPIGTHLLWGDRVQVSSINGKYATVKARGKKDVLVDKNHLGGESLLEFYFIDVGQGDGVLVRTPDHRHILIDGGFSRKLQPAGKNAADFVDWKFVKDYGKSNIELDAVIASHNDADHYGGLWDLLNSDASTKEELDAQNVLVEQFYHAGLSWWQGTGGRRTLGSHVGSSDGAMWVDLLNDRDSVEQASSSGAGKKLAGEWAKLFESVLGAKNKAGQATPVSRLSHLTEYLPGFEKAAGKASIKVLAPVEFTVGGKPALRKFPGTESINTNGQSVLLRVDYGRARVLLTGDLNSASQFALLKDYAGNALEFECDVAKACHHGSDDISYSFLQTMRPAVTVVSSGDNEGHDHPRPSILAASATTGYFQMDSVRDRIISPLIYSTELARSYKLSKAKKLTGELNNAPIELKGTALQESVLEFTVASGSNRNKERVVGKTHFVSDLIYGLVNVRTNGERILCATMSELDKTWDIKVINARF
jgi:beta-lactamase superfamily II metal-dependent hydrolase